MASNQDVIIRSAVTGGFEDVSKSMLISGVGLAAMNIDETAGSGGRESSV